MSDGQNVAPRRVGGHVSAAGGLPKVVERAVAIGADCVPLLISAPQQWRPAAHKDADVAAFREQVSVHGLTPVFIHAIYLLNLASPNPVLRTRSVETLISHLAWADRIGAAGVIFHPGSHTGAGDEAGERAVVESLATVLAAHTGSSALLLETTAGGRGSVGGRFEQLGRVIEQLGGERRLQVCLDTAHIFAAGYPCTTPDGLQETLDTFDQTVGLDRLTCIHVNDSKTPFGSHADRHANVGEGEIGVVGFWHLLQHPVIASRPLVLEVPGFDNQGPDALNVQLLRAIGAAASPAEALAAVEALRRAATAR